MTLPLPPEYGIEFLRCEVGSTLHGTGLPGGEDTDYMGIFLEWPSSTVGLRKVEHWGRRTQPDGVRSGPGDVDVMAYSLRKWAALALNGNPSVLLLLHAPTDKLVLTSRLAVELRENAAWFASKRAGYAFLGYMEQQRQRLTGERGTAGRVRKVHTPDGRQVIDWKYAMHMLRLGYQGVEFLQTGRLTLPIPPEQGDFLRSVRRGGVDRDFVLYTGETLETQVKALLDDDSPLPETPDFDEVSDWVADAHLRTWMEAIPRGAEDADLGGG